MMKKTFCFFLLCLFVSALPVWASTEDSAFAAVVETQTATAFEDEMYDSYFISGEAFGLPERTIRPLPVSKKGRRKQAGPNIFVEGGGRFGMGSIIPLGAKKNLAHIVYKYNKAWGFDIAGITYFNPAFGALAGLSFAQVECEMSYSNYSSSYRGQLSYHTGGTDLNWSDVHCYGTTAYIKEKYKLGFLEVPLMLAIRSRRIYNNVGFKLAFPVQMVSKYETSATDIFVDTIYSTGIALPNPLQLTNNSPDNALRGEYDINSGKRKLWDTFLLFVIDLGYRFPIGEAAYVSLGGYFEYSFNNDLPKEDENARLIDLNGADIASYGGLLKAGLVKGCTYYKVGLRLQVGFGVGTHNLRLNTKVL